jgi:hypothetical protein
VSARSLVNVVLAVLVAVVGAALYLRPKPLPQPAYALLPHASETVQRIEIERPNKPVIVLVRDGPQWRMESPARGRLNEVALERLLDLARARSAQRMAATELARFELDSPWARIRFGAHAFEFGMSNPLTEELYVRSGEHVYVVPTRLAANVPADASKLLAHRLFGPEERPVAFRLAEFSVHHDDGRWHLLPAAGDVSQDDLARCVDHWRLASSLVSQPSAQEWEQASAGKPTIAIRLQDGREIAVAVRARMPYLVLVRSDEGLEYHLPAKLADVLLARPDADAGNAR